MPSPLVRVTLRPSKDKYLQRGYPWVFKNQIEQIDGDPATGDVVEIAGAGGEVYGRGFYHADAVIAVRFLTTNLDRPIDEAFFRDRLLKALALRDAAFAGATHARLVYSESDALPGTLVDRYGDVLTWTTICAGMDRRRDLLLDLLEELVAPKAIIERNDAWLRGKDKLPEQTGVLRGSFEGVAEIEEHGVRFHVDPLHGAGTGFPIVHRAHRDLVRRLAARRRVLDVFCGEGGFSVAAACGGAEHVHGLDVSNLALERAEHNAALNDVADRFSIEQAEALDRIGKLVTEQPGYDFVILDPPPFAQSRRQVDDATRSYQRLNISALQLLPPGGLLATASSSPALSEDDFETLIDYSARKAGARLRLLHRGHQPADYPVLASMPETQYLSFYVFEKLADELPKA